MKPRIEDAGEKLWGARKDMGASDPGGSSVLSLPVLEQLWPKIWPRHHIKTGGYAYQASSGNELTVLQSRP